MTAERSRRCSTAASRAVLRLAAHTRRDGPLRGDADGGRGRARGRANFRAHQGRTGRREAARREAGRPPARGSPSGIAPRPRPAPRSSPPSSGSCSSAVSRCAASPPSFASARWRRRAAACGTRISSPASSSGLKECRREEARETEEARHEPQTAARPLRPRPEQGRHVQHRGVRRDVPTRCSGSVSKRCSTAAGIRH